MVTILNTFSKNNNKKLTESRTKGLLVPGLACKNFGSCHSVLIIQKGKQSEKSTSQIHKRIEVTGQIVALNMERLQANTENHNFQE